MTRSYNKKGLAVPRQSNAMTPKTLIILATLISSSWGTWLPERNDNSGHAKSHNQRTIHLGPKKRANLYVKEPGETSYFEYDEGINKSASTNLRPFVKQGAADHQAHTRDYHHKAEQGQHQQQRAQESSKKSISRRKPSEGEVPKHNTKRHHHRAKHQGYSRYRQLKTTNNSDKKLYYRHWSSSSKKTTNDFTPNKVVTTIIPSKTDPNSKYVPAGCKCPI